MRNLITVSALGLVMAAPLAAHAQQNTNSELEALKQQLQVLTQKVQELEARQAETAQKTGQVEERVAGVESTNDNQTDQLAKSGAKVASADWASKIKLKGDFRYRHEGIDQEAAPQRDRERLRVRFGIDAKINDTLNAGFQLATGDDTDPRSTNATLTDANQRKSLRLDQAYVDWKAFDNAVVTLGKQKYPWFRPGLSMFYDGDINPEGASFKYGAKTGLFVNAWGFWLSEVNTSRAGVAGADANLFGAQLGYKWAAPWGTLTAYAMYNDFGAVQDSTVNFADFPAGNSTYAATSECLLPAPVSGATQCLLFDFNTFEVGAQADMKVGNLPLMLFANYAENEDPGDLNTAYSLGFQLGKADPGKFEFGIVHQEIEKDSLFGALTDSDFAGGATQGSGQQFRFGYGLATGWTLNAQYFLNKRNFDQTNELDYKRLQLDLNYKF
ncbi:MAG: putative porin [Steroidobacteraceae bacterium]